MACRSAAYMERPTNFAGRTLALRDLCAAAAAPARHHLRIRPTPGVPRLMGAA